MRKWNGLIGSVAVGLLIVGAQTSRTQTKIEKDAVRPVTNSARSAGKYPQTFDAVLKTLARGFYDARWDQARWDNVAAKYRAKIDAAQSPHEFAAVVNEMLEEAHASHLAYVSDEDVEYYMMLGVKTGSVTGHVVEQIGIMGKNTPAGFLVTAALDNSPAARADIEAGDVIVSGDGKPFRSAASFRGKAGTTVRLTIRRNDAAEPLSIEVQPEKKDALGAFLDATKASAHILTLDGKRVGYVHLWTMANEAFRETLQSLLLNRLANTDGLILDLRDGYGGNPFGYSDVLFRPDVRWTTQRRKDTAFTQHTGYAKPVVVLTNEGTRSAKEFLTYQLKAAKRVAVVGSRTAGAFLGASFEEVGGGLLEMPVVDLQVDGKRLENSGVEPDVTVASAHSYTAADAQLKAGEQVLLRLIRAQKAVEDDKLLRVW